MVVEGHGGIVDLRFERKRKKKTKKRRWWRQLQLRCDSNNGQSSVTL